MIDFSNCINDLSTLRLSSWAESLPETTQEVLDPKRWGDLNQWYQAIDALPKLKSEHLKCHLSTVEIGLAEEIGQSEVKQLKHNLMALHPWRKGPFQIYGLVIDTEWRSDFKWDRLKDHISPLKNRRVLDVGCGSGYHCWRMYGEQAALVLGIDPSPKFVLQFYALKGLLSRAVPVHLLPFALEDMPKDKPSFDTVFSMGVLYHRRSPIDHLMHLKACLVKDGELVLETLVCEDDAGKRGEGTVIFPEDRYAKMRNVWFLPSPTLLCSWLRRCGFKNVELIDVSDTSTEEQRSTEWMHFESLKDFLDPNDSSKTIEGYLAPRRAIVTANV